MNRYQPKPKPFPEQSIVLPEMKKFCRIPNVLLKDELLTRINDVLCRLKLMVMPEHATLAPPRYMQIGWGGFVDWTTNNAKGVV